MKNQVIRVWRKIAVGAMAGLVVLAMAGCGKGESAEGAGMRTESEEGGGMRTESATAKDSGMASMAGKEGEAESTPEPTTTPKVTSSPESTAAPDPTPKPTPSAEEIYQEMLELSLMYEGNFANLKKVMEKLRAGEEVYVAALGGSVTEGAGAGNNDNGYAYQFAAELGSTYAVNPKEQIHFVNAGLSGTPSTLGLMRYKKDVLDPLGQAPDLLIIEFAVNDWQEVTNGRAYESLVYEALTAKENCAVICLCSVAKTAWNTQESFLTIAKHYQIPLVSMKKAVFEPLGNTRIPATTYFSDDYHPKYYGHKLMKDCLMHLFAVADEAEEQEPAEIPAEAVKGRDFTGLVNVDSESKVKGMKMGSFGDVDENVVTMHFTKSISFPNNFHHQAGSKNDPLTMKVKCKKILINYKTSTSASFGKADFYVDGKPVTTADGYSAGGWNNCNVLLVLDEAEAATHTLEVKMADDSLDKAFTVLSISYAE